jgi:3-hydroxy-9,10-secoandrosta-1,3,5(10)-triene-9,17-dione monooxygenase
MSTDQIAVADLNMTRTKRTLRERAAELAPRIAERAQEVDEKRYVPEETIEELLDAGLFHAFLPKAYGGEEAAPDDFVGAVIEIGKACASTAWVLSVLGLHHWEMSLMPKQLQDELYADNPRTLLSSSYAARTTARKVDGGFLISGRWPTSSGVLHSQWVIVGAHVVDGDRTYPYNFVVPLSEMKVIDDWFTLGLRGTGSRSVAGEDVFVPAYRAMDREVLYAGFGPGLRVNTNPIYRIPEGILVSTQGASSAIGAAWGFWNEFRRQATGKVRRLDQVDIGADRATLLKLAQARATLEDHEKVMLGTLREAHRKAVAGEAYTPGEIEHGVFDISRCSAAALSVPQSLMPLLGAPAVYQSNPLQRMYRDLLTSRQHGTQDMEVTGPAMLNAEMGNDNDTNFYSLSEARIAAARARAERLYG